MNADHILAGIDCALFDPSLVVSLRKLLVGLAVSGNLRTTAAGTVASSPAEMPSSDSLPIEPSELPAAGMTAERFVRLGSIAEVKKGETGIQKAKPGRFPLVVTAQQRATTDHYDFDGPSAIVPLVSSTGHGKASLHRLHYQDGQYAVGNILAAIFPRSGSGITARFLYEYLSAFKDELLVTRMTGTANVALTIGKLKEVPVPIVSPRCQEVVDELMALCDRLEAAQAERDARRDRLVSASLARVTEPDSANATSTTTSARFHLDHFARLTTRPEHVKQLRQTILNLAVRGRLVPQDTSTQPMFFGRMLAEEYEPLPAAWTVTTLSGLLDGDSQNGFSRKPDDAPDGVPILRISAGTVRADGLVAEEEYKLIGGVPDAQREQYKVLPGDLLACRFNGNKRFVGRLALFSGYSGKAFIYPDKLIRLRVNQRAVIPNLLRYFGESDLVRAEVEGFCATTVGNWGISATNLKSVRFPVPPLAEQQRIVAKVDELMALCDQLEASLASAATDRARLLEALLHEALAPAA